MNNLNEPVSDLKLEQFVADDLPEAEHERIRLRAESDQLLKARIDSLLKSNEEILAETPPGLAAQRISARLESADVGKGSAPANWKWLLPALPAVAAALFLLVRDAAIEDPAWTGIKGLEPHLVLYRQSADGSERLENNSRAKEDDRIQMVYNSAGRTYGLIFSVDGNGQVTRHFPESGPAHRLRTDRPDTLQFAYKLDDAPRRERFYFVSGDTAFDASGIIARALGDTAASAQPLTISPSLDQHVTTLIKE